MSAMETMLLNVLQKALPPEVMAMLTPEKMQEMGERINAYIVDTREKLDKIVEQNEKIIASTKLLLERSDNEQRKGSGGSGKRSTGNSGGSGSD